MNTSDWRVLYRDHLDQDRTSQGILSKEGALKQASNLYYRQRAELYEIGGPNGLTQSRNYALDISPQVVADQGEAKLHAPLLASARGVRFLVAAPVLRRRPRIAPPLAASGCSETVAWAPRGRYHEGLCGF
jgi:hypothetical protein